MRFDIALRVILALFVFCQIVVSSASLPRPWHDPAWLANNSNVYYANGRDIWFPGLFNKPLEDLKLETIRSENLGDTRFRWLVSTAIKNREGALAAGIKCAAIYMDIEGNPPNRINAMMNTTLHGAGEGFKAGVFVGAIFGGGIGAVLGGVGAVPGSAIGAAAGGILGGAIGGLGSFLNSLFSNTQDNRILELGNACSDYGKKWRVAMDSAADAYDYSVGILDSEWENAAGAYEKLEFSGICDNDYYSYGRETCEYLGSLVTPANSNAAVWHGADSGKLAALTGELEKNIVLQLPDTGTYHNIMKTIWNETGAINEARAIASLAGRTADEARQEANALASTAREKKRNMKQKISALEAQMPEKITEGTTIYNAIANEKQQSIGGLFADIKNADVDASAQYEDADSQYAERRRGYLKNAIILYKNAAAAYSGIDAKISRINSEIRDIVDEKREDAIAVLRQFEQMGRDKFIPDEARRNYEKALAEFGSADKSDAPGSKFEKYGNTAMHARFAINIFENRPLEKIAAVRAGANRIKALIRNAMHDGLDVEFENEEMELLEGIEESWVLGNLKTMEESIVARAGIVFGFLEEKRKTLLGEVELGGEMTADLKTSMINGEKGAFYEDGKINYKNAIGRLAEIAGVYGEINDELKKSREIIVLNAMVKRSEVYLDAIEPDKPVNVSIRLTVANALGYAVNTTEVWFDFPYEIEILKADISKGAENIIDLTRQGTGLAVIFRHIGPYANYEIKIERSEVLAETTKQKTTAIGKIDGSADVSEEATLRLSIDAVMSFDKETEIDGKTYYGGKIKRGTHQLKKYYEVADAFSIRAENYHANRIGLKTKVEFDYLINAAMDLQKISVSAQLNSEDIKNLDIVSLSGERITNTRKLANGLVLFDVLDLRADREATVRIMYNLENASDYINEKVALLGSENLSENNKKLLEETKDRFAKNDTEAAIKKITEIERALETEGRERQKIENEHGRLAAELNDKLGKLQNALNAARNSNISSWIMDAIETRAGEINATLTNNPVPSEESIERLAEMKKSYDITRDLRKKLLNEFNGLKDRMLRLGTLEMPESFRDAEEALIITRDKTDPAYIVEAAEKITHARLDTEAGERERNDGIGKLRLEFEGIRKRAGMMLADYKKEANIAKSGRYNYLFTADSKDVEKQINDMEKRIESSSISMQEMNKGMEKLGKDVEKIDAILGNLETESRNRAISLGSMLNSASVGAEEKNRINNKITRMKELIDRKEYINALKAGDSILEDFKNAGGKDNNSLIILGFTALFILAALVAYIYKFSGRFPGRRESKKELRKLKRIGNEG